MATTVTSDSTSRVIRVDFGGRRFTDPRRWEWKLLDADVEVDLSDPSMPDLTVVAFQAQRVVNGQMRNIQRLWGSSYESAYADARDTVLAYLRERGEVE